MRISPAQIVLIFFLSAVTIGTVLLILPFSHAAAIPVKLIDVVFTAASAVCVTGLTTVDIGSTFSFIGQLIILLFIQIGGLGYMTLATIVALFIGKINLKERMVVKEVVDPFTFEGLAGFLKGVLKITLAIEFIGAIILSLCFYSKFPIAKAVYYGIFHSVSAFCNAGFSLFSDNLASFNHNWSVILVMSLLIIIGGLGYVVLSELIQGKKWRNFSLHTKIVLSTTGILIIFGTVIIFALESGNPETIGKFSFGDKILNSYFQSVAPRTAGFNTIPTSSLFISSIFLTMVLMFIGASPGGTGGGIKTSTFSVLVMSFLSTIRGERQPNIFGRRVTADIIIKSIAVFIGATFVITFISFLLVLIEKKGFINIMFETISAFGTVGLSRGITSDLTGAGKLLIIITMLVGRVGPLTLGAAILYNEEKDMFRYPEEKVLVG
ncbi:MAG: hypothetical protein AUJ85_09735 [Elusimicrobia bacterium CG1_02_37_114]|nr:MAG: hypothetical protein AUJ85_09735 [Elusimicrobia bacterium CG1_02_37_114]PIV54047.1 MAG: Trk family potassium uptake protein [Elusimicrobia bacterium CG02_land_8_20_14_3_00_37_13]PIZ13399.1 MAG: Trk family potassium uptake protein [Elusimicrobia bacterium CG_4_10_14_0_8_um_filter_37_32]